MSASPALWWVGQPPAQPGQGPKTSWVYLLAVALLLDDGLLLSDPYVLHLLLAKAAAKAATSCQCPPPSPRFHPWCFQLLLISVTIHLLLFAVTFLLADILPLAKAFAIAASVKNWHENLTEAPFGCRGPYQLKLTPLCIDRCYSSVILACKQQ